MNFLDEILDIIQTGGKSIAEVSTESGVKYDRLSSYKYGRGKPKSEDSDKLQTWLKKYKLKKGIDNEGEPPQPVTSLRENVSHITDSMKDRIILGLVESNRKLVDNTVDLTQMAKESWNKVTVNVPQETPLTSESRFLDVLELFAEIGSGKHWGSKQEALAELSKRFVGKKPNKKIKDTQIG